MDVLTYAFMFVSFPVIHLGTRRDEGWKHYILPKSEDDMTYSTGFSIMNSCRTLNSRLIHELHSRASVHIKLTTMFLLLPRDHCQMRVGQGETIAIGFNWVGQRTNGIQLNSPNMLKPTQFFFFLNTFSTFPFPHL